MTEPASDNDLLLIMELLINLLYYANTMNERDRGPFDITMGSADDMARETKRLIQNAECILEQCCNMGIRICDYDDNMPEPRYYISKRDTAVDAAVEAAPDLVDVLLGYMDIRNEKDSGYKQQALLSIYRYMEPMRLEYKRSPIGSVSEEFFKAMNIFGVRHNASNQIKLRANMKIDVYDKLFRMALYMLQSTDVLKYKDEIKMLRSGNEN